MCEGDRKLYKICTIRKNSFFYTEDYVGVPFIQGFKGAVNESYRIDYKTIGQFTGLKDCEGNEVWEGDILEGESKSEIVYAKGTFAISLIGYNKRVFSCPLCYYIKEDEMVDGKVVGNNFDKKK